MREYVAIITAAIITTLLVLVVSPSLAVLSEEINAGVSVGLRY